MKYQMFLFSEKIKKTISNCHLLTFVPQRNTVDFQQHWMLKNNSIITFQPVNIHIFYFYFLMQCQIIFFFKKNNLERSLIFSEK